MALWKDILRASALGASRLGFLDIYNLARGGLNKSQVAIIVYHRVADLMEAPFSLRPVETQQFEKQIRYLCKSFEILSLKELITLVLNRRSLPTKGVIITFDDGYRDNYLHAYPILKKYHVPATIFLTTGHIGTTEPFWWDRIGYAIFKTGLRELEVNSSKRFSLSSASERRQAINIICEEAKRLEEKEKERFISKFVQTCGVDIPTDLGDKLILGWDEVMEMKENGVSFGAHGVTHASLTKVSPERALYEIIESKKVIESKLGQPVFAFCYPYGHFNASTIQLVKESGFLCGVTTLNKMVDTHEDLYTLGRVISGKNSDTLKVYISRFYAEYRGLFGPHRTKHPPK